MEQHRSHRRSLLSAAQDWPLVALLLHVIRRCHSSCDDIQQLHMLIVAGGELDAGGTHVTFVLKSSLRLLLLQLLPLLCAAIAASAPLLSLQPLLSAARLLSLLPLQWHGVSHLFADVDAATDRV